MTAIKQRRIAIVAGEKSGDILGARLMCALKKHHPELHFEGIGGEEMLAEGFETFHSMERLSIMGFIEVIPRFLELFQLRRRLIKHWLQSPPDLFIGIDAPDFNLNIEAKLHQSGIKTVHYVSPSLWAWRQKKVHKIKGNLDLMLTLFPFEATFYENHGIPVAFTGHPLADEIPEYSDKGNARKQLKLPTAHKVLAVLPGSRSSELRYLAKPFIQALQQLQFKDPSLLLVAPMANKKLHQHFQELCETHAPDLKITLIDGQSRQVMAASDCILMASGTAVLEGMFVGRPMVAAGKLSAITVAIIRGLGMLNTQYYTLPNNLADEELVPELIQEDVTVKNIISKVESICTMSPHDKQHMLQRFSELHAELKRDASATAAKIISRQFL